MIRIPTIFVQYLEVIVDHGYFSLIFYLKYFSIFNQYRRLFILRLIQFVFFL